MGGGGVAPGRRRGAASAWRPRCGAAPRRDGHPRPRPEVAPGAPRVSAPVRGVRVALPLPAGPPPAPRLSRGSLELIYHGTLTLPYGVDAAVRGVLHARQQGADARLTILGDGPERSRLEQLVVSLSAAAVIRFEHPLPQRELRARLGRADAVLVPTRLDAMTRYSLSNKLLEAVHLGIPVLAARLPSYSHYLDDASAWFWNPGDATDLVRAILAFARATPEERCERARAAQRALQGIAWPVERVRLLDAYRHLLEEDDSHAARMVAIRSAAPPSP